MQLKKKISTKITSKKYMHTFQFEILGVCWNCGNEISPLGFWIPVATHHLSCISSPHKISIHLIDNEKWACAHQTWYTCLQEAICPAHKGSKPNLQKGQCSTHMPAYASTLFISTMFGGNGFILANPKPFCNLSKSVTSTSWHLFEATTSCSKLY